MTLTAEQWLTHGMTAHRGGHLPTAETAYYQVIRLDPWNRDGHNGMGVVKFQRGRFDEAIIHYQDAAALSPQWTIPPSNIGAALLDMDRAADAIPFLAEAYRLDPSNTAALTNLASAFLRTNRLSDARTLMLHAQETNPDFPDTLVNLGLVEACENKPFLAQRYFEQAIHAAGDNPQFARSKALAYKNLGTAYLGAFDFENGWPFYEHRFRADNTPHRYSAHPNWDGTPQPDGHLIVVAEQGLGDEILYLNMVSDVQRAFGGTVTWEADNRLFPILQLSVHSSKTRFAARTLQLAREYPGATHRIDAGTLGKFLRPSIDAFPKDWFCAANEGAYLYPGTYQAPRGKTRVGISWRSVNTLHGISKTVVLDEWAPALASLQGAGAEIVSLQYGDTPDLPPWIERLPFDTRYNIAALGRAICECSHVITVSNTTAHLAAALGVPTTILIPGGMSRYWYWGFDPAKDTTPWYPKAKIVRGGAQPWPEVIHAAALDILRQST